MQTLFDVWKKLCEGVYLNKTAFLIPRWNIWYTQPFRRHAVFMFKPLFTGASCSNYEASRQFQTVISY